VSDKTHTVVFQPAGIRGEIEDGKSLLQASRELGVEIESVCGGESTCGRCTVRIKDGIFERIGICSSRDHVSPRLPVEDAFFTPGRVAEGYRLACATSVRGDLVVFVPEEARMGDQVVRKAVTDRKINVNPSVRTYYVEMVPPTLHDQSGDYERICNALKQQHGLNPPVLDYRVLQRMPGLLRQADWRVTVCIWRGNQTTEIVKIYPGRIKSAVGLAVDVGTTTVAAYLCDLATGKVLNYDSMMNPQVRYGEDVMSRITYAMSHKDGVRELKDTITEALNTLVCRVTEAAGYAPGDVLELAIVGNTAMHHGFLGINPTHLGRAPYVPALAHSINIKAHDLGLNLAEGANVFVLPNVAGFVGADNVGVLIAEEPYNKDDRQLIIDIGTNGELIMGNRERLLSSSCATGPAFEGAHIDFGMRAASGAIERIRIDPITKEPRFKVVGTERWSDQMGPDSIRAKGICGSGIIDGVAELLKAGIIDRTGKFVQGYRHSRIRKGEVCDEYVLAWANETSTGRDITISVKDVRAVQLAKAAMYAGAKLMMQELGYEHLDRVILAGAFGSVVDCESALTIGMFPDVPLEKVQAVGNAAGDGARMALLDADKRIEAEEWARRVDYVELAANPSFTREYMMAMSLPHAKDTFPHLDAVLGA
jgi:uncharacterized 2Fe-2S/4Fe-4S cluster protein (DUF4445 family)